MAGLTSLTADALDAMRSTFSSKFDSELQSAADPSYEGITERDTFGSEGYVPFLMGGVGSGQEWVNGTSRLMLPIAEYGIRFVGKRYENSVQLPVIQIADSPTVKAVKVASAMADSAITHEAENAWTVLSGNKVGFDNVPLFGNHSYYAADGTTVIGGPYSNDFYSASNTYVNAAGATVIYPTWYVTSKKSIIIADREGEDYTSQFYGVEGSTIRFVYDAVAYGWRARKIFAPNYWANTARCNLPLNSANVHFVLAQMAQYKNDAGKLLGSKATTCAFPRSLLPAANLLFKAEVVGATTNTDFGLLETICTDYLPG
jgi:phage major head subunit gpT-like protein